MMLFPLIVALSDIHVFRSIYGHAGFLRAGGISPIDFRPNLFQHATSLLGPQEATRSNPSIPPDPPPPPSPRSSELRMINSFTSLTKILYDMYILKVIHVHHDLRQMVITLV